MKNDQNCRFETKLEIHELQMALTAVLNLLVWYKSRYKKAEERIKEGSSGKTILKMKHAVIKKMENKEAVANVCYIGQHRSITMPGTLERFSKVLLKLKGCMNAHKNAISLSSYRFGLGPLPPLFTIQALRHWFYYWVFC